MEEKIRISVLLQTYGNLLTHKQHSFLDDYYNNDLSLSEIAENNNITRQAVRDNLKKGAQKLFEYEEKLKFMEKTISQEEKIAEIIEQITSIKAKSSDRQISNILEKVKYQLNCLV